MLAVEDTIKCRKIKRPEKGEECLRQSIINVRYYFAIQFVDAYTNYSFLKFRQVAWCTGFNW